MSSTPSSSTTAPGLDDPGTVAERGNARARHRRRRRRFLGLLLLVVLLAAAAWVAWYLGYARWYEETTDAYVTADVVQITPQVSGTVVRIGADDNDFVRQGQPLVWLDAADAHVALEQAQAALAQAVRRVGAQFSNVDAAQADVRVREAALKQAQADFRRRRQLAAAGAVSAEEYTHAQDALASARDNLGAAQARLAQAHAAVQGTRVDSHPDVLAAVAALRQAWLADQRTTLPAPVSGHVAQRVVQVGQHVAPGAPLMAVVPLHAAWVDANFKETQLRHMRLGQPVQLHSDLYGRSVTYRGHVAGLGIGTGSAFALLPAQNATGNWIKIVQRLPVRIDLDPQPLAEHPLRVGLSMTARVDLHDDGGPLLAQVPRQTPVLDTGVYDHDDSALRALVIDIIAANAPAGAADAMQGPGKVAAGGG